MWQRIHWGRQFKDTSEKKHSGEKSNKCSQCDFISSRADNLRRHLKSHSGEKPNKCNQCVIWGNIWNHSVEKNQTNAASVTLPALTQVLWWDTQTGTEQEKSDHLTSWANPLMHKNWWNKYQHFTQWQRKTILYSSAGRQKIGFKIDDDNYQGRC